MYFYCKVIVDHMESFKKLFLSHFYFKELEGDNMSTLVWKFKRLFGEYFDKFLQGDVGPLDDGSLIKKSHSSHC